MTLQTDIGLQPRGTRRAQCLGVVGQAMMGNMKKTMACRGASSVQTSRWILPSLLQKYASELWH